MNPVSGSGELGEDYAGFDLQNYRKFMAEFRIPQYKRDIAFLRKYAVGGRLLDIGCGTGEFLDVAGKTGFQAYGLEPSKIAFDIARKAHRVVRGEFKNVGFKQNYFDVITLWSVLEHVPAPMNFLRRVHALLRKKGLLALRVPDAQGLLPLLALWLYRISFRRIGWPLGVLYQLDWHYKHYYGYDFHTLSLLLEQTRFKVVAFRSENSFNWRTLDLRIDYLPVGASLRKIIRGVLGVVLLLAKIMKKEDEIVVIARKNY
jgi:SAM-dependent methyltransferase